MKGKNRKRTLIFGAIVIAIIIIFFLAWIFKSMFFSAPLSAIRPAAVSGQFYPASKEALAREIKFYLQSTTPDSERFSPATPEFKGSQVKILIVPHAGYDYSASIMAAAYRALAGQKLKRVYLLGNSHQHYFSGAALDDRQAWASPLGLVRIDQEKVAELKAAAEKSNPSVLQINSAVHDGDHVLEVQLPFLQGVLGDNFKIIPILLGNTGDTDYLALAEILSESLEEGDILVVSSDMSHYPGYQEAQSIDRLALEKIKNRDLAGLEELSREATQNIPNEQTILCGLEAVKISLVLAKKLNFSAEILAYRNSGDSLLGDKNRVVGYGALVFLAGTTPLAANNFLNAKQQGILKDIAKKSVEKYVRDGLKLSLSIKDQDLQQTAGVFVTLKKDGQLRGCLGEIIASRALWQVVQDMAIAAATQDQRFVPVSPSELDSLDYEVSVLTPPQAISDWRRIRLGQDGVIISKGKQSGVFLPQVALEGSWTLEQFLEQLCSQKAGLPADCYQNDPEVKISIFQAQVF